MNLDFYGINIVNVIIHALIAIGITVPLGKVHEILHVIKAKQLGYKCTKFALCKNEIEVHQKDCDGNCGDKCFTKNDPNWKNVAYAPYFVMFPLGFLLIVFGWQPWQGGTFILGVFIAGVAVILLHCISLPFEGKDVRRKLSELQETESESVVEKE